MKLPVYSRADLSRTVALVVALTAISTSAVAREFRVADTQSEDYPTALALRNMGGLIAERSGNFVPAMNVARSIYNSVRPIRTIADIRGLPIRVQQSELMSDMIKARGAGPVQLAYGQVLTGLATRLIDDAENNGPSFVTTDHYNYAGYYSLTEHSMSPEVPIMSRKAWESPSAEDRKIFREAAMRSGHFMHEKWKDLEEQSRRQAEAAGVTIVTDVDRRSFEAAMAGIYAKAQRDPAVSELIERIRKVE